ncbi:bifunctional 4-hydroxy-2-oxoglutarate aldolase/2-dehydro-3-deoxy-phosphogluconate aldolase [Acidobacterium sp. S8]|uniref:bifunctional 4-hydroxy-2-oxoglutarate aldolase/2-dehydro-3-deoxy-phosphogluconate aldolase n=1 Tax=Acidobacterium sp. S8 TaxID=1641854 RepID=UPI00131D6D8A|nr:bifunctional 4-hydroxy-2-oxoglutarate aldolase/2-dehydro-3-deoxy-phosphogluconate aldolase [Acidobacterium sp. S8]
MQGKTTHRQTKDDVLSAIRKHRLVPVVRVASREQALCAAEGIVSAKFPLIEITMTVPGAIDIIAELSARYECQLIVGAGTVLEAATCESALRAGAGFIVSPSFDAAVIRTANDHDTVCIAGGLTTTEIVAARQAGADMVKVFPCGLVGGPRYIRALKGPLPDIQLIPSSGVNLETAAEFLESGSTAVAVGEPIFQKRALEAGDFEVIGKNATRFIEICTIQ